MKAMRTPAARVRGLGSAKTGTQHWWAQRLSALALIPLVLWFVASVVTMAGADYTVFRAWAGSPVVAGLLLLLIVATFYHGYLGLQVVVEDYVHHEAWKLGTLLFLKAASIVLALTGVLAVLTILFGG
jgi:succinate dehydrogenase / fumarate reductase membrane anchor subunit